MSAKVTAPAGTRAACRAFSTAPATALAWKSTKRRAWGRTRPGTCKAGQVVTVEPGLYYPEIGGVRLEDVALITRTRPRNLTRFEKVLEI